MNFLENDLMQEQLYPFTLTRAVADIRIGILTIREKWLLIKGTGFFHDVSANVLPSPEVIRAISKDESIETCSDLVQINHPWEIFQFNDRAIRDDFTLLTHNRVSAPIPDTVTVINPQSVFIEEGARLQYCTLNASTGPIYISRNAEIMEGSLVRGPFALGEGSVVKMGSKIYGATTVGPYCVVGGEIKNSVIFGYSNKAHDGYLGDSVIGEWCNLGGGTSNSNIKNTAGQVKIANPYRSSTITAGNKCGLLMGDYCRSAINTSFYTGTVTGACCNIFGAGLMPSFIPSFSWGVTGDKKYEYSKALQDIAAWMSMKNHLLSEKEILRLKYIYAHNTI